MNSAIIFSTLNAKYIHASPAPYCLAAGVKLYLSKLYPEVKVVEGNINGNEDDFLKELSDNDPLFAGFTCYIWNIEKTLSICKKLKMSCPDSVIALGGPEVSFNAREILEKHEYIDLVFSGEGEESVPKYLDIRFLQGNDDRKALKTVQGLSFREDDGSCHIGEQAKNKNIPPSPLEAGYAKALKGRISYTESSRNCPYNCAYCLSGGSGKPIYFDEKQTFEQIITLSKESKTVKFVDRTFNADRDRANKILLFIKESYGREIPEGVTFHFEISGDILHSSTMELLALMPKGAVQLEIGIQSFNRQTLSAVGRHTDLQKLSENVKTLVNFGNIHIHTDLIAGLPYEDMKSFKESFDRAFSLGAHMLQLGFLKLLHGCRMRENSLDFPCTHDEKPPYEVKSTPWLLPSELETLHLTEHTLDKAYNSHAFEFVLEYIFKELHESSAFDFFAELGMYLKEQNSLSHTSLEKFTELFYGFCVKKYQREERFKDLFICDRLAKVNTGHIPAFLYIEEGRRATLKKLCKKENRPERQGIRRGFSCLNENDRAVFADYDESEKDVISGRYRLHQIQISQLL